MAAAVAAAPLTNLSDPSFQIRQRASAALWSQGEAARPGLERVAAGPDPEAAGRARAVLARFDAADYPGTPESIAATVREFRSGTARERLAATRVLLDQLAPGRKALKPLLARHVPAADRAEFFTRFAQLTRRDIPLMLLEGDAGGAAELAALAAATPGLDGPADLAMFYASLGDPAAAMTPARGLPVAEAFALAAAGDRAGAAAAAARGESPDADERMRLVDAILEDAGDWDALLKRPERPVNSRDGLRAHRLNRAGRPAEAEAHLDALGRDPVGGGGTLQGVDPSAIGLFLNGRTDAGLARSERLGLNAHIVADVKLARLDLAGALEAVRDAPPAALEEAQGRPDPAAQVMAASRRGRLLVLAGDPAAGDEAFALGHRVAAAAKEFDWPSAYQLLRMQARAGRGVEAAKGLDAFLAPELSGRDGASSYWRPFLIEAVFDDDPDSAEVLLKALAPGDGHAAAACYRLLHGRAGAAELAVVERLALAGRAGEARRRAALAVAACYREHARPGDAIRVLSDAAGPPDAKPPVEPPGGRSGVGAGRLFGTDEAFLFWVELAELLLADGRPAESAARALQGWRHDPNNPALLMLASRAKRAANDIAEADRLATLSHRASLGNVRARGRYLSFLIDRGFVNAAARETELTRKLAWIPEPNAGNAWSQMQKVGVARRDPGLAAEANRRISAHILRTQYYGFVEGTAYARVPHALLGYAALAAAQARDFAAARRGCEELLRQLPGNAEELGPVVRELDAAGRAADAEALFRLGWADHTKRVAQFPNSAWVRSEAAEYACECRRELPAARDLAARAAELDPAGESGRAALAECQFRLGARDAAVAVMARLLAEHPRSYDYARRLAFYRAGEPNAQLPPAD